MTRLRIALLSLLVSLSGACTESSASAVQTPPPNTPLLVSVTGSGTVTISPGGQSCAAACTATFQLGTPLTLTAAPATGFSFAGWSGGACASQPSMCSLILAANEHETAIFAALPPQPAPTVSVQPTAASLLAGQSLQFAATLLNSADQGIAWTIQEGADGGTISSLGLYTAPQLAGTFHVIATSVAHPDVTASAAVSVTVPPPPPPPHLTYSPSFVTCYLGNECDIPAPSGPDLPGAVFSITPSLPRGLQLAPASGAISGSAGLAEQAQEYVVTETNPQTTVSGTINLAVSPLVVSGTVSGATTSGVYVWIIGVSFGTAGGDVITNADGGYTSGGFSAGEYTIRPELQGYYFIPTSITVSVSPESPISVGNDFVALPDFCGADGWCWENPLLQGNELDDLWGTSANDVWAVGRSGTVVHYDGEEWSGLHIGATDDLAGVWSDTPNDVWIVSTAGNAYHFDGSSWRAQSLTSSMTLGAQLSGVWGSGPNDVWAVGSNGSILHFDGQTWASAAGGGSGSLYKVWGSGPDDVWTVGAAGLILHWNGQAWASIASGTTSDLTGLSGTGPSDVWAVGYQEPNGVIQHWNGAVWSSAASLAGAGLQSVWANAPNDAWAVGLLDAAHWDGTSWTELPSPAPDSILFSIWGSGPGIGWAAGANGTTVSLAGASWTRDTQGVVVNLSAIWGPDQNSVAAVGDQGTILYSDLMSWQVDFSPTTEGIRGIWGLSPGDAWAVGDSGTILRSFPFWNIAASPTINDLKCIWGSSANDIWAAGTGGASVHWDGTAWSLAPAIAGEKIIYGLWGTAANNVWAVGEQGAISHFDGTSWRPTSVGTQDLFGIWGSSASDIWATGAAGTLLHFDGSAWSSVGIQGAQMSFHGIAGTGSNNVWLVGDSGAIFHFDGTSWTQLFTGATSNALYAVWASGTGAVWAAGDGGSILRLAP